MDNFFDEKFVGFGLCVASEDVDEFLGQLEICGFKTHITPWRPIKDKAKVNVDQMSALINHNVTIVSVFDLKDVTDDAVCS